MKTYVIFDPQHVYGVRLVEALRRDFGMLPVCVYSDSRAELAARRQFPELAAHNIAGRYFLDQTPLPELAGQLASRHRIAAVVPYFEQAIGPGAELLGLLGLRWNDPVVLARFRDKGALKAHIARCDRELPLGLARPVASAQEVLQAPLPEHFVIKPVDGFGNCDIGFFHGGSAAASAVGDYFAAHRGGRFILEEFFVGREYAVNGQMDHRGEPQVVSLMLYERVAGNGRPNLYHRTHHVQRRDPAFAVVADYAARAMRATGLVRCPFHMEVILTAEGPRLVEVGARMGGTHYALMSQDVHGGSLDLFALAAHYYVSDRDFGPPPLDWDFYDRVHYLHLDGICASEGRVAKLEGMDVVEGMPEFRGWVVKPRLGAMLRRTIDIYTVPYSFHMASMASAGELWAASEAAKGALRINDGASGWQRARARQRHLAGALRLRAQLIAARLGGRCRRRLGQLRAAAGLS